MLDKTFGKENGKKISFKTMWGEGSGGIGGGGIANMFRTGGFPD